MTLLLADIIGIARHAHEANRLLCESTGDMSQTDWNNAPQWQKDSAISGVNFIIANPSATPADSHESWLKEKRAHGWVYGPEKNVEMKEHPCMVPYNELPEAQRNKDLVFTTLVKSAIFILSTDQP
jgi:hypothetical protein